MATTEGSETEAAASNPLSDGGDTDTGSENSGVDPGPEAKVRAAPFSMRSCSAAKPALLFV